jgi:RNA polymerase sigma factor (TIGR02999 family)
MVSGVPTAPGEVTRLLGAYRAGDAQAAERLIPLIYDELRRLARRELAREYAPVTFTPTDLAHEAYLKLSGTALHAGDRAHLLALVARVMRQLMVDRARRRRARKRGGGFAPVTLSQERGTSRTFDADELLALDDAMAQLDPRQRQVVECRFFGGLDEEEIAQALGVSVRTVRRDWVKARAWLHHALYAQAAP